MKKFKRLGLILLFSFLLTIISPVFAVPVIGQSSQIQNLVEQGKILYETGRFIESVNLLKQAAFKYRVHGDKLNQAMTLSNISLAYQKLGQFQNAEKAINSSLQLLRFIPKNQVYAQSLDIKGSLQFAQGEFQNSILTWQNAEKIYDKLKLQPALIQSRINQAQAMQALGLFIKAQKTLSSVRESLNQQPNSLLKSVGLRSVGDILRIVGNFDESKKVLQQSLDIALSLKANQEIGETLISLGNTVRIQQVKNSRNSAIKFYQQAVSVAPNKSNLSLQAQLNLLNLFVEMQRFTDAWKIIPKIEVKINNLALGRDTIYMRINFAKNLQNLNHKTTSDKALMLDIAEILSTAVKQAKIIQDKRAEAYALMHLGQLYEESQQLKAAQKLTKQALNITNSIKAEDITYKLKWQMGRLYRQQENIQKAIENYNLAWEILKSLRSDLVAVDYNMQFSFRESIEPVYRQYVNLILKSIDKDQKSSQKKLLIAREVIESLQLAKIDNFFSSACFNTKVVLDDIIDRDNLSTAIIYPIILQDRLEVIIKLPLSPLIHYTTSVSNQEVEETVKKLSSDIEEQKIGNDNQAQFKKLYSWLIKPADKYLETSKVNNLVFVLDGSLSNIPPAALYDGKQYLIEKYSIVISPGLQLYELKSLQKRKLNLLSAGLSEERLGFPKLDYVEQELQEIQSQVSNAKILLNQKFTSQAIEKQVNQKSYSIVHLATHGQFSSNSDDTFLLAYDQRIKVKELSQLLRFREENQEEPIELLVLSACETAAGDKQAALGLAGVAIQAGARSTVASLWALNDASTAELMSQFYQNLKKPNTTKSEALRNAQLTLLKQEEYSIPYFWSPYVLIGNWL